MKFGIQEEIHVLLSFLDIKKNWWNDEQLKVNIWS